MKGLYLSIVLDAIQLFTGSNESASSSESIIYSTLAGLKARNFKYMTTCIAFLKAQRGLSPMPKKIVTKMVIVPHDSVVV